MSHGLSFDECIAWFDACRRLMNAERVGRTDSEAVGALASATRRAAHHAAADAREMLKAG
jgi:hypothetical protein